MNLHLADVLVHIDQTLSSERRSEIEDSLRALDGVVSVQHSDERPHLSVVAYIPGRITSAAILSRINSQGIDAELVGL